MFATVRGTLTRCILESEDGKKYTLRIEAVSKPITGFFTIMKRRNSWILVKVLRQQQCENSQVGERERGDFLRPYLPTTISLSSNHFSFSEEIEVLVRQHKLQAVSQLLILSVFKKLKSSDESLKIKTKHFCVRINSKTIRQCIKQQKLKLIRQYLNHNPSFRLTMLVVWVMRMQVRESINQFFKSTTPKQVDKLLLSNNSEPYGVQGNRR